MAKKKQDKTVKIPVSEIEVNGVYKTYVNDIVKILEINKNTELIKLMNVTGSFSQWTSFKNIFLVTRLY